MPKIGGQDGDPIQLQPEDLVIGGPKDKFPGTAAFRAAITADAGAQVQPVDLRITGDRDKARLLRNKPTSLIESVRSDKLNIVEEPLYPLTNEPNLPSDLVIVDPAAMAGTHVNEELPFPPARLATRGVDFPVGHGDAGQDRTVFDLGTAGQPGVTHEIPLINKIKRRPGDRTGLVVRGALGADPLPAARVAGPGIAFPLGPKEPFSLLITDFTDRALGLGDPGDRLTQETFREKTITPLRVTEPKRLPGSGGRPLA